jgi:hypothetical protein
MVYYIRGSDAKSVCALQRIILWRVAISKRHKDDNTGDDDCNNVARLCTYVHLK